LEAAAAADQPTEISQAAAAGVADFFLSTIFSCRQEHIT
jgi:hypothetical protein